VSLSAATGVFRISCYKQLKWRASQAACAASALKHGRVLSITSSHVSRVKLACFPDLLLRIKIFHRSLASLLPLQLRALSGSA
jgi:hypothetical protein